MSKNKVFKKGDKIMYLKQCYWGMEFKPTKVVERNTQPPLQLYERIIPTNYPLTHEHYWELEVINSRMDNEYPDEIVKCVGVDPNNYSGEISFSVNHREDLPLTPAFINRI